MPDLWNHGPPHLEFLFRHELIAFLKIAIDHSAFEEWEQSFCESCADRLRYGRPLTERQEDVLRRGLLKKLWDNDPTLWD